MNAALVTDPGAAVARWRADMLTEALDELRAAIAAEDPWRAWEAAGNVVFAQGLCAAGTPGAVPMAREVAHELERALALLLRARP